MKEAGEAKHSSCLQFQNCILTLPNTRQAWTWGIAPTALSAGEKVHNSCSLSLKLQQLHEDNVSAGMWESLLLLLLLFCMWFSISWPKFCTIYTVHVPFEWSLKYLPVLNRFQITCDLIYNCRGLHSVFCLKYLLSSKSATYVIHCLKINRKNKLNHE